jgi:hypothetical protein
MASDAVADAIRAHLTANWTESPIAWENEPFERPISDDGTPEPFVIFELSGDLYAQKSIGAGTQAANRWDEDGRLWLHVFVAAGTGNSVVRRHAKQLADLFRGQLLLADSLEFGDASLGAGQPGDDDGAYYSVSVSVDWRRVEA